MLKGLVICKFYLYNIDRTIYLTVFIALQNLSDVGHPFLCVQWFLPTWTLVTLGLPSKAKPALKPGAKLVAPTDLPRRTTNIAL